VCVPSCDDGGAGAALDAISGFGVDAEAAERRRRSRRPSGRHRLWPGTADDDVAAVKGPAVSYPAAGCALPLDRLGFQGCRWGLWRRHRSTSCLVTPRPPPLFYMRSAAGGPPAIDGLGAPPIRAREGKARLGSVGLRDGKEIKLTLTSICFPTGLHYI